MDAGWGWILLAAIAIALWIAAAALKQHRLRRLAEAKFAELMKKYNDRSLVEAIMRGSVWQGMSEEQLIDSRGAPEDRDQTIYKAKTKVTWKYGRIGKTGFESVFSWKTASSSGGRIRERD